MNTEFKESIDDKINYSHSCQKRLEKCSSVTDANTFKSKKSNLYIELTQAHGGNCRTERKSPQLDEFLFCLKLKMIGISRLLDTHQFDSQMIANQDANYLLNELTKKIKKFQKQSNKKVIDGQNKCKMLEIRIIKFQAIVKSLESDLQFCRKQLDRHTKVNENEMKKMESKVKEYEKEKINVESKLRSSTQVLDQQLKIISELQAQIKKLNKNLKVGQDSVFEKQKEIVRLNNSMNFLLLKNSQQCENLKDSIMKKSEQNNRLNIEVMNLKDVVDNKSQKIEEKRKEYNKLYSKSQKTQLDLKIVSDQYLRLQYDFVEMKARFDNEMKVFFAKQQEMAVLNGQLERKLCLKIGEIKILIERVDQVRITQHHQVHSQVQWMHNQIRNALALLQDESKNQDRFLQQMFEIDIQLAIQETKNTFKARIQQLQDEIDQLQAILHRKQIN